MCCSQIGNADKPASGRRRLFCQIRPCGFFRRDAPFGQFANCPVTPRNRAALVPVQLDQFRERAPDGLRRPLRLLRRHRGQGVLQANIERPAQLTAKRAILRSRSLYLLNNIGFVLPKYAIIYLRLYYFSARLLVTSRMARSRRATARDSYRLSLSSSGSALRTASAVRSGSCAGIVAEGSMRSGKMGGALPDKIDLRYRISSASEPKLCGGSSAPSADTRWIRATLTRRTRARSSSA